MRCRGFFSLSEQGVPVLDERFEAALAGRRGALLATVDSWTSTERAERVVRAGGRILLACVDEFREGGGPLLPVLRPKDVVVEPEQFPNWTSDRCHPVLMADRHNVTNALCDIDNDVSGARMPFHARPAQASWFEPQRAARRLFHLPHHLYQHLRRT